MAVLLPPWSGWMSNVADFLAVEQKASLHNTSYSSGDILSSDLTLDSDYQAAVFRIYVVMDTAGTFDVRRDRGGTVVTENLNDGDNLTSDAGYLFDVLVSRDDDGVNFQYSTSATIKTLIVGQVGGGT